ncbi:hypothetical protein GbCGDNIH9_10015 [Granulibacter bethesdensis]|uniref:Uncharacterized protein n=1 Tax=Granulibacter bethesdensis TaxID=364410 RepID=A0AAC9YGF4_9PROT|nr:hypothetical protein GbCGDNIH8_10015 [Granulibacter bethesdensis]ASV62782.1 hypothetical protein GbCGDNIH9_10015 [Granulibacter bethesdensis]
MTVQYALTEEGTRLEPVVEVMRTFGLWLKERGHCPEQAPTAE